MAGDLLDCDHGIDLMWPCFECQSEAGRIAKEYEMIGSSPAILELKRQGRLVVLSTHQMDQAERLCDAICLINAGKLKGLPI